MCWFKRIIISVLLIVVFLSSFCYGAYADEYYERYVYYIVSSKEAFRWSALYDEDTDSYDYLDAAMYGEDIPWIRERKYEIFGLLSSDPDVVRVKALKNRDYRFWLKKPGNARVTYVANGKNRIDDYYVLKYSNPCKSFKLGKTEYSAQFNNTYYYRVHLGNKVKKLNDKISVKPAKGWKLVDIRLGYIEHFKNGQKIKLKFKKNKFVDYHIYATFLKEGTNYGCTLELALGND